MSKSKKSITRDEHILLGCELQKYQKAIFEYFNPLQDAYGKTSKAFLKWSKLQDSFDQFRCEMDNQWFRDVSAGRIKGFPFPDDNRSPYYTNRDDADSPYHMSNICKLLENPIPTNLHLKE